MKKQKRTLQPRTCWCGKQFIPKRSTQKHCSPEHSRTYNSASRSKYGRNLMITNPEAAIQWYMKRRTEGTKQ